MYSFFSFLLGLFLFFPASAFAAGASATLQGLSQTGSAAGFGAQPVPYTVFIANGITALLGVTGILFVGLAVYGGILYLTAGGNDEKVKKAKGMLTSAIIGIAIVVVSYSLTVFLFEQVGSALSPSEASQGDSAESVIWRMDRELENLEQNP